MPSVKESDEGEVEIQKVTLKWYDGKNPIPTKDVTEKEKAKGNKRKKEHDHDHDHDHDDSDPTFFGWLQGYDDSCMEGASVSIVGFFLLYYIIVAGMTQRN